MANKEQNTMMAKRMKEEGLSRWPNSIHLSPSYGWRGVGFDERKQAAASPRHVELSGINMIGLLGGVLAERMGFKSPIKLPV